MPFMDQARANAHTPLTRAKRAKTIADNALVRAAVNFDAAEKRAALAEANYNAIREAARAEAATAPPISPETRVKVRRLLIGGAS